MLATGKATILEVANRQVAERPEAKEPDASGGRFAGLMAHWIQPQAVAKPPEKAQGGGLETGHRKASATNAAAGSPSATPEAPPASDGARSALKPGSPSAPTPPATPAHRSSSAPAAADDAAASANDPAASASDPAAAAGLPDPISQVPAPDQALATMAAQSLSVLQAGLPGDPIPYAPAAVPHGATMVKSALATVDPVLDPVLSQAATSPQAVLADDSSTTKGKGLTKDLQAALEALQTTPPTADPVAVKTGPNLAAPPDPHEAPAVAPAKGGNQLTADKVLDYFAKGNTVGVTLEQFPASPVPLGTQGMRFRIVSPVAGNLVLLDLTDSGNLTQLFPNQYTRDKVRDGYILANSPIVVPDAYYGIRFDASTPEKGTLIALVTNGPVEMPVAVKTRKIEVIPVEEAAAEYLPAIAGALNAPVDTKAKTETHALDWSVATLRYEILGR